MDSIGSGTIIAGRNNAYINDVYLTSGSCVCVNLIEKNAEAAGAQCIVATVYTTGSPSDGQSIRVWINSTVPSDTDFRYAIMDVSGSKPI